MLSAWLLSSLLALCSVPALADDKRSAPAPEDLLPLSEFEDDPIGIDAQPLPAPKDPAPKPTGRTVQLEPGFGPMPPPFRARSGDALTGIPALRERSHGIEVKLDAGLAEVTVRMGFESHSDGGAELAYRLPVPDGAAPATLRVCQVDPGAQDVRRPDGATHARSTQRRCRDGIVATASDATDAYDASVLARGSGGQPRPVARLRRVRDARGTALLLHAAPVSSAAPLNVTVRYYAPASMHAGVVRLRLPARGMDPRAATAELRLRAPALLDARVDGLASDGQPVEVDPRRPVSLSARMATGGLALSGAAYPCPEGRCARAVAAAGPQPPQPRAIWLALDLSPSMEGAARNRVPLALAELLQAAPPGTTVRALGFASRGQVLIATPTPAADVPLAPLLGPLGHEGLGAATRFEAAVSIARNWLGERSPGGPAPLLVIVGDGGLTAGRARPFAQARKLGLEVSVVNLADRAISAPLAAGVAHTGGTVVDAAEAAERALHGRSADRLREQLTALFSPKAPRTVVRGRDVPDGKRPQLRAGELHVWEGPIGRGKWTVRGGGRRLRLGPAPEGLATALAWTDAHSLLAVDPRDIGHADDDWPAPPPVRTRRDRRPPPCDPRGPEQRHGGISSDTKPVAVAVQRSCAPEDAAQDASSVLGRGMPAEPLLGMLRERIVPVARGCFRRDRAGRGDYAVRAVFHFRLADREIVEARIEGQLQPALRTCLLGAVDGLEVPRFTGVVNVKYPVFTEREPPPERVELSAGTASELDALMGDAPDPPASQ